MIAIAAVLAACVGSALMVLFEGGRGTGAGFVLLGAGLSGLLFADGHLAEAALVLGGSLGCGGLAAISPHRPFSLGPTTPRIILVILAAAGGVWLAVFLLQPAGAREAVVLAPVSILGCALLGGIRRGNFAFLAAALVVVATTGAAWFGGGPAVAAEAAVVALLLASTPRWWRSQFQHS